ncbi:hypothetical protein ACTQ49_01960 [Luteococcus sp. Sow4_B9]|uniref:hypothetical protein n=1 Tax=Luteococcus sp. Sow4_B9 TaxID=3438792 RepID=UPI003F94A24C
MADSVKRYRETAATVVLAISAGFIVMSLVEWGYLLVKGGTLVSASRAIGGSSLSVVMVLACVATALWCTLVKPVTARGRALARMAAGLVGLAALLQLVFLVIGLTNVPGGVFLAVVEALGGLLEVAIKAAAARLLMVVGRAEERDVEQPQAPAPAAGVEPEADPEPEKQAASWTADQAAGAVWTRAGDAASGAEASGWGRPGQASSGWQVASEQPEANTREITSGPWATAGDVASGTVPASGSSAPDNGARPDGGRTVSWEPVPRDPER